MILAWVGCGLRRDMHEVFRTLTVPRTPPANRNSITSESRNKLRTSTISAPASSSSAVSGEGGSPRCSSSGCTRRSRGLNRTTGGSCTFCCAGCYGKAALGKQPDLQLPIRATPPILMQPQTGNLLQSCPSDLMVHRRQVRMRHGSEAGRRDLCMQQL